MDPRTAEQTKGLTWAELRSGDQIAVEIRNVYATGKGPQMGPSLAKVHKPDQPIELGPEDYGHWHQFGEGEVPTGALVGFGPMRSYSRGDKAWKGLVGISWPSGGDYILSPASAVKPAGDWNSKCPGCGRGIYVGFTSVEHEGGACPAR